MLGSIRAMAERRSLASDDRASDSVIAAISVGGAVVVACAWPLAVPLLSVTAGAGAGAAVSASLLRCCAAAGGRRFGLAAKVGSAVKARGGGALISGPVANSDNGDQSSDTRASSTSVFIR